MLLNERTWKKDAAWSGAISVAVYLVLPDILSNLETVAFLMAAALCSFILLQWAQMTLEDIRRKRESLCITAKRPAKRHSGKRIDFPVRRVLIIPAEKVRDGE